MREALAEVADPADAVFLQRFFKTGPGQYGEGDVFIGVRVPATRAVVRRFRGLPPQGLDYDEIDALLDSPVHEHRLAGALLLVARYKKDPQGVFDRYLAAVRRGRINNWDLVDASSEFIVGEHLVDRDRALLDEFAESGSLWERRVAVLATFQFIKKGRSKSVV